jgi:hypothetical protein
VIDQVSRKDAKEAAAAAVAAEAETDEVLENAFSGLKFSQDEEESDNHSDMSLERENMAQDIVSIASSVNSMALEEARAEVARLKPEKYPAEQALEQERKAKAKVASPNQILHDKIQKETAGVIDTIKEMDNCSLWWVKQ